MCVYMTTCFVGNSFFWLLYLGTVDTSMDMHKVGEWLLLIIRLCYQLNYLVMSFFCTTDINIPGSIVLVIMKCNTILKPMHHTIVIQAVTSELVTKHYIYYWILCLGIIGNVIARKGTYHSYILSLVIL